MSGLNISYEIGHGAGEITYLEEKTINVKEPSNIATVLAGEIVNEILENALDIVTQANSTGKHWKDVKESRSNSTASTNQSLTKLPKNDKMTTEKVGDIVANLETNIHQAISDDKTNARTLDKEIKKLVTELLAPPYEISYEAIPVKGGGVGDQLSKDIAQVIISEPHTEPEVTRTVEKKSRVTDLVKNSPQIINEYLKIDENSKQTQEEWEETEERLIRVIELDHVKHGEENFKVPKKMQPEDVALPEDENEDIDEVILMPMDDHIMDIVDLTSAPFREEENEINLENSTLLNEDKRFTHEKINAAFEPTPNTKMNNSEEQEMSGDSAVKDKRRKKKKWNIGSRLWGFFKKSHKQARESIPTATPE